MRTINEIICELEANEAEAAARRQAEEAEREALENAIAAAREEKERALMRGDIAAFSEASSKQEFSEGRLAQLASVYFYTPEQIRSYADEVNAANYARIREIRKKIAGLVGQICTLEKEAEQENALAGRAHRAILDSLGGDTTAKWGRIPRELKSAAGMISLASVEKLPETYVRKYL